MTKDYVGEIRREQRIISENITDLLLPEVFQQPGPEYDPFAYAALEKSNLNVDVLKGVMMYTDWLIFRRMLPETGWESQSLPTHEEIPYQDLSGRIEVSPEILEKTVSLLHEQPRIPAVGNVVEKTLYPIKGLIADYVILFEPPKAVKNYQALFK